MDLQKLLQKLTKDLGISTKEISTRLEIGLRTVQNYISGKQDIPDSTKKLIRYEFAEFLPEEERLVSGPGENNGGATVDTTAIEALKKENEALKEKLKNAQRVANLLERNTELLEDQVKIYKDRLNIIDDKSKTA